MTSPPLTPPPTHSTRRGFTDGPPWGRLRRSAADPSPPVRIWAGLVRDPSHGPLPSLLLVLTAATGIVDAVSILGLGRVFVANMTGNTAIELVLVVLATLLSAVSPASRTVVVAVPVAALLAVAMGYRTPWRAVWPYPISPPRC